MDISTTFCVEYDYRKLRGKIKEVFGTEGKFAEAIGRTHNFVSSVFNGKSYFEARDIEAGSSALGIEVEDIGKFFYTKCSQNEN